MKTLSQVLKSITTITELIHQKHPQLYFLLIETPLFLENNGENPDIVDFTQYLETLEYQLETFDDGLLIK